MRNLTLALPLIAAAALLATTARADDVTIKMMETSDIHGNYFSYDFMSDCPTAGGLPRVAAYVKEQRELHGADRCVLLDNGDLLQGQPCAYYANFVDTVGEHLAARMLNYMGYDAGCFGNHDVETGHPVYDRWTRDCQYPVLGANIMSAGSGDNYAQPYHVIERGGVKIAVIGLLTAAIPMWLPESLWSGLRFDDIVASARKWVQTVKERENPDVIVGLLHCGLEGNNMNGFNENAAKEIALTVPGYDVVFYGHDHRPYCQQVTNQTTGRGVWLLNPGSTGLNVAEATLSAQVDDQGNVTISQITGRLAAMDQYEPDAQFDAEFESDRQQARDYVVEQVGELADDIDAFDYYFGPSTLGDLLHSVQNGQVDADISLVAPLTTDEVFKAGAVSVKDIFKLYRYENRIEVFELTGDEVRGALDKAYSMWTSTITAPGDHALAVRERDGRPRMAAYSSFMMSAAGVRYQVDLTKPAGEKVTILSMADGSAFCPDSTYRVAVNSYLGSGGGSLLTDGAGISVDDLPARIVYTTEKDLRYYIIQYFRLSDGPVTVPSVSQWEFVPVEVAAPALARDRELLSPPEKH